MFILHWIFRLSLLLCRRSGSFVLMLPMVTLNTSSCMWEKFVLPTLSTQFLLATLWQERWWKNCYCQELTSSKLELVQVQFAQPGKRLELGIPNFLRFLRYALTNKRTEFLDCLILSNLCLLHYYVHSCCNEFWHIHVKQSWL